jgi:hypothetical protein
MSEHIPPTEAELTLMDDDPCLLQFVGLSWAEEIRCRGREIRRLRKLAEKWLFRTHVNLSRLRGDLPLAEELAISLTEIHGETYTSKMAKRRWEGECRWCGTAHDGGPEQCPEGE